MENISLTNLLHLAIRKIHILIAVALIGAIMAFIYCEFIAVPKYSAMGSILVTNGGSLVQENQSSTSTPNKSVTNTDIVASLQLSNTIIDILTTNDIYKEVAKDLGDDITYNKLISSSSIKRRNEDTLFIDITFTASTPAIAKKMTNTFLELAPEYITQYIPNSKSNVVDKADKATQIFPRTTTTVLLAFILSAAIAYAVIFILNYVNTTINSEEDIKENYPLLIIGNIPDFASANAKGYYKYNPYSKGDFTSGKK